ncbi:7498_t:CDS:2, partial [Ambispora leptoticha]
MELMVLLLQYSLTRCSVSVHYFPSAPSELRLRSVKPIHLLNTRDDNNDDNPDNDNTPYWDDAIDKYFDHPDHKDFQSITYPEYFKNYVISTKQPSQHSRSFHTCDRKNRIVKRQQELLGHHSIYRNHFQSIFPIRYQQAIDSLRKSHLEERDNLSNAYESVIRSLLAEFQNQDLSKFMFAQFLSLEKYPPHTNFQSSLILDTNQYSIYNTLCNVWGKFSNGKHPYFLLTGLAGTRKSFMINQIISYLKSKNKKCLLMAPTGVAAQSINDKTIHSTLKIRLTNNHYETLLH